MATLLMYVGNDGEEHYYHSYDRSLKLGKFGSRDRAHVFFRLEAAQDMAQKLRPLDIVLRTIPDPESGVPLITSTILEPRDYPDALRSMENLIKYFRTDGYAFGTLGDDRKWTPDEVVIRHLNWFNEAYSVLNTASNILLDPTTENIERAYGLLTAIIAARP